MIFKRGVRLTDNSFYSFRKFVGVEESYVLNTVGEFFVLNSSSTGQKKETV